MTTTLQNPPTQQQTPVRAVTGVLDIDANGKGHLRAADLLPTPSDPQVSPRSSVDTACARATSSTGCTATGAPSPRSPGWAAASPTGTAATSAT